MFETFRPRCWRNEVILVKSALFGRMKVGRCIGDEASASELGPMFQKSLGCFANVLNLLDQKCSGRSECDVFIPSEDLRSTKPCSTQLPMYLEASYSCVNGRFTTSNTLPINIASSSYQNGCIGYTHNLNQSL